jgi:hypothetical protein
MYSDILNIQYFQDRGAPWRPDFDFDFDEISGLLAKRASVEDNFDRCQPAMALAGGLTGAAMTTHGFLPAMTRSSLPTSNIAYRTSVFSASQNTPISQVGKCKSHGP